MREDFTIRHYIDLLTPRVSELQMRAKRSRSDAAGKLLEESLEHLREAFEELQVSEEELRVQNDESAAAQYQMEAELHEARNLFELAPEPCLVTDSLGSLRAANRAACALLGIEPYQVAGKPLVVFVPEPDRHLFRRALNGLVGEGRVEGWRLRLAPWRREPVEVVATAALQASEGGERRVHWVLRRVGAAEAAERDQALELARLMVRGAPVAMAALDLDGTVLLWNDAAEGLLGWGEDEVLGRPNPALAGEPELQPPLALARRRPPLQRVEAEGRRHDGTRLRLSLQASPLLDAAGAVRGSVVVMEEVPDGAGARPAAAAAPVRRWKPDEMRRVLVGRGHGEFVDRLRAGIAAGTTLGYLRPGDRLPSIREAAQAAGVDHRVVASAYRWLAAEGTVEVRNRHGVMVAAPPAPDLPELGETAEWLARVLEEACAHQVKVSQLPDLLRRWTASARLHCACVESCPDSLAALTHELKHQWGLDTYPVALARGTTPGHPGEGLAEVLRSADLVVTTPFHAGTIRGTAEALGKPLVVVHASEEMVAAVEEALRAGPLTAVVADAEYGERLRAVAGGERLRVVLADDGEAVAALDPAQPVLLTRAAQQRTAARLRLLVPVSPSLSPAAAGEIARVMVARNLAAERALAV